MEIYVVRGGDSLYGIARRYGTDAAELARINQLNDPRGLCPAWRCSFLAARRTDAR